MNYYEYKSARRNAFSELRFSSELFERRNREKRGLKTIGIIAGGCIILYVILQDIISLPFLFEPFRTLYMTDINYQIAVNSIFSILGLLIPFLFGALLLNKKMLLPELPLGKPDNLPLMITSVPFGFLICLAGNYATSVFVYASEKAGVELTAPEFPVPEDFFGRVLYAVSIAVIPALVEEFALRGVVMQSLRRYGDWFAIIASGAVFAILHGNLIQSPFAFIAGIGIGYAVCITNSIWTGVIIHFCNNFYSVMTEFLISDVTNEAVLNLIWNTTQVLIYAVCIIGGVVFFIIKGRKRLPPSRSLLYNREKWKALLLNPTMLIAIVIMLYITAKYVKIL
ncbi:MAG: CPBP family intramembrane metalloprotease [Clostridia bacterium]|nr:CPBP family intramembrane metalloprotease [Clostridia bacterium]